MKDLLAWIRRVFLQAAISVVICGVGAYALGKTHLIVPLIAGCLVGAACWSVIGFRMIKSAVLSVDEAKKSMQIGFVIRLLLIMGTLIAAVHISTEVFWAVVLGLFLMSGIMMINAIVYAYHSNVGRKK